MDKRVERVVREGVELEEFAFTESKKKLASSECLTKVGARLVKGRPPGSSEAFRAVRQTKD